MHSMTAFARHDLVLPFGTLAWEIRSVNQRYLESHFKLFDTFRQLEMPLRDLVKAQINRGKIEVQLKFQASLSALPELDEQVMQTLANTYAQLQNHFPNLAPLEAFSLLNYPGLVKNSTQNTDIADFEPSILQSFSDLLNTFNAARLAEGLALKTLMLSKLEAMQIQVDIVNQRLPERLQTHQAKLQQRLAELLGNHELDTVRLHQELALLAQKLDIQEEIDRLNTHIQTVRQTFESTEPVGRRLDFLMQEMNREANTLGSKSQDSETTQASVELKVLIEQIREQVQNIE